MKLRYTFVSLVGLATSCIDPVQDVGSTQQDATVILSVRPSNPPGPCIGVECPTLQAAYDAIVSDNGVVSDVYIIEVYGNGSTPYFPAHPIGEPRPPSSTSAPYYERWTKWAPYSSITIRAAVGQTPVFDGDADGPGMNNEPLPSFIYFRLPVNWWVNITIEGLTIRNFQNAALVLHGWFSGNQCNNPDSWNGAFTIRDNVFENIGNASLGLSRFACDSTVPECCPRSEDPACQPGDVGINCNDSTGYAVIQLMASYGNTIEGNVARHIWDCADKANEIHFIYATAGYQNVIRRNFIDDHSGDPFKFRRGATWYTVEKNYTHRGFNRAPGQEYLITTSGVDEPPVSSIFFAENLLVYPYDSTFLLSGEEPVCTPGEPDLCFNGGVYACFDNPVYGCTGCPIPEEQGGCFSTVEPCLQGPDGNPETCDGLPPNAQKFCADAFTQARLVDAGPVAPEATAATSFDADGDGVAELFVAFEEQGVSWIVRSKLRPYYLGDVIWSSVSGERVIVMTAGDFDGDGTEELITATEDSSSNTRIYRGTGTPWRSASEVNGLTDLGLQGFAPIYGPTIGWDVMAMTAGNYDTSNGNDELLTAFTRVSTGQTYVYRGNGRTSVTDLGVVYGPQNWKIRAMATADFGNSTSGSHTGDGIDDVVTAFYIPGEDRVYAGNGINSLTLRELLRSQTERVTAMAAGELDGDGDADLLTSLSEIVEGYRQVYRGNGWSLKIYNPNGVKNLGMVYTDQTWSVPLLVVDEFRAGNAHEAATVFTTPGSIQIWAGDGTTLWTSSTAPNGLTTHWKFYDLDW